MKIVMRSVAILVTVILLCSVASADDAPWPVSRALDALNTLLGTQLAVGDLHHYVAEYRIFPGPLLGCPGGQAAVMTPGYIVLLGYRGKLYDFRVSERGAVWRCEDVTQGLHWGQHKPRRRPGIH